MYVRLIICTATYMNIGHADKKYMYMYMHM